MQSGNATEEKVRESLKPWRLVSSHCWRYSIEDQMVACHLKSYRPDLSYKRITGKAYKDIVQHLFTCFLYLGLPKVLKTDNAPLKLWRGCLLTLNDFQKLLGDVN